jgi:hypothetical protein
VWVQVVLPWALSEFPGAREARGKRSTRKHTSWKWDIYTIICLFTFKSQVVDMTLDKSNRARTSFLESNEGKFGYMVLPQNSN